jgi:heat shock protein HslJ
VKPPGRPGPAVLTPAQRRDCQDAGVPTRRSRPIFSATVALATAAGLLLAACGGDDAGATAPTSARRPLEGPTWVLDVDQLDIDDVGDVVPTIRFLEGQISGTTGCNSFRGTYTLEGSDLRLSPLATTLIGCPPPLDEVERQILDRLARVTSYAISQQRLSLRAGDETVLLYDVSEPRLEGQWVASGVLYDDAFRSIVGDVELTADFDRAGAVTGSGGCNRFRAGYRVDGQSLEIGPVVSTKIACPTEEVSAQELGYFAALESAATWDQVGDELTIANGGGQRAVTFRRA